MATFDLIRLIDRHPPDDRATAVSDSTKAPPTQQQSRRSNDNSQKTLNSSNAPQNHNNYNGNRENAKSRRYGNQTNGGPKQSKAVSEHNANSKEVLSNNNNLESKEILIKEST